MKMTRMTKKQMRELQVEQSKEKLKELMEQYDHTIYTKLEHVSKSGMMRRISCYVQDEKGYQMDITDLVADVSGYKEDSRNPGLRVTGCGMDMGFAVVYNASSSLYKHEDGSYSHDGAYKIKQRWM